MRTIPLAAILLSCPALAAPNGDDVVIACPSIPADRTVGGTEGAGPVVGSHPTLFILVDYDDVPFATTQAAWSSHLDSVADFYTEVSYGLLDIVPAGESPASGAQNGVVGPYRLGPSHPWWVWGSQWIFGGTNSQLVAAQAIAAADANVDFASFDEDSNGGISFDELHVVVIVSGYEEAYGSVLGCNQAPATWGHRWGLFSPVVVDGKAVGGQANGGGYMMIGELRPTGGGCPPNTAQDTYGVICHELGHDLGIPDLYDTSSSISGSSRGLGRWCLMGSGNWNGSPSGANPAHMSVWCKVELGWISPTVAAAAGAQALARIEDSPAALLVYPGGVPGPEYFLVENRRQVLHDSALPGEGLLIYHVNEAQIAAQAPFNRVNADETRKGIDLECADQPAAGHFVDADELDANLSSGDADDPFYAGNATAFGTIGSGSPDSRRYGGEDSGVSITGISGIGDTMTFTVNPGAPGASPRLVPSPASISAVAGGGSTFSFDAGAAFAGAAYLLLGTASGTAPGFAAFGLPIPLNPDGFTGLTMGGLGPPFVVGFAGTLTPSGTASASVVVPPLGPLPFPVPLDFVAGVVDGDALHELDFVSNPARITLN